MRTILTGFAVILGVFGFAQKSAAETPSEVLKIKVQIEFSGETMAPANRGATSRGGWIVATNEDGESVYSLEKTIRASSLPFRSEVGDVEVSISQTGQIGIATSVGDADAGASGSVNLPRGSDNKFLRSIAPTVLEVRGGDYASGSWSFSGSMSVQVAAAPILTP